MPTAEELCALCAQLARLPGGVAAAQPDFFGTFITLTEATPEGGEVWQLAEGGRLILHAQGASWRLVLENTQAAEEIAVYPADLVAVARAESVPPMLLALLLIAMGRIEDQRRLKRALPRLDGAAKDMMLMSVCRLCG